MWTSKELSDTAGYSSITVADVQGVRTYMTFTARAGVGVRASDGKLMFSYTKAANQVANIATPVFFNDKVFFTSGYGAGGGLLALTAKDGEVAATEVYHTPNMRLSCDAIAAGRTRSSATGACTCAIRTRCSRTTSKPCAESYSTVGVCAAPTTNGRIISLSSCEMM